MNKITAQQARSISEKYIRREKELYVERYVEGIYTKIENAANKGRTETVLCAPIYYEDIEQILIADGYTVRRRNYESYLETVDDMIIKW